MYTFRLRVPHVFVCLFHLNKQWQVPQTLARVTSSVAQAAVAGNAAVSDDGGGAAHGGVGSTDDSSDADDVDQAGQGALGALNTLAFALAEITRHAGCSAAVTAGAPTAIADLLACLREAQQPHHRGANASGSDRASNDIGGDVGGRGGGGGGSVGGARASGASKGAIVVCGDEQFVTCVIETVWNALESDQHSAVATCKNIAAAQEAVDGLASCFHRLITGPTATTTARQLRNDCATVVRTTHNRICPPPPPPHAHTHTLTHCYL
jgi:hypothetical protein